jgi:hypothetical protein
MGHTGSGLRILVSHPFAMGLRMDGAHGACGLRVVVSHPFAMELRMDGARVFARGF